MPTATETDRAREMRLRRAANARNLVLRKSRAVRGSAPWYLSDETTGTYVHVYMTIDEVEAYLNSP